MKRRFQALCRVYRNLGIFVVLWTLVAGGTAIISSKQLFYHSQEVALGQAKGLYQNVLDARTWNASHGGVYVPVTPSTQPNPYLADVPKRDVQTLDGEKLTLISPSYMTRQIAQIGWMRDGIGTHITSLEPIRPQNGPDSWERKALNSFEKGNKEAFEFTDIIPERPVFRYMAPMTTTQECFECHSERKYSPIKVRGGLSVTIPVDALVDTFKGQLHILWASIAFSWILGLGIIGLVGNSFQLKQENLNRLEEMSLNDPLTGIHNRRGFLALAQQQLKLATRMGKEVFLLFMDLDKFKQINDTYGHKEGDFVLVTVAQVLSETFRRSDIVSRFGGDEFVVLALNTDHDGARSAINRFTAAIETKNNEIDRPYRIKLSVGLVEFDPKNPLSLEEMILQADTKMYENKENNKQ